MVVGLKKDTVTMENRQAMIDWMFVRKEVSGFQADRLRDLWYGWDEKD